MPLCLCGGISLPSNHISAQAPRLQTWTLEQGHLSFGSAASSGPLAAGSLQKPFVAKAWAAAHPDQPTPRFHCSSASACWFAAGHGDLGLARALAVSCNAYFRGLAEDTPPAILEGAFHGEGFSPVPRSPDLAIGLAGAEGMPGIRPGELLAAYSRLVREPWPVGESVRSEVLAGLREAALKGTAGALGQRGWYAKTGTVPAWDSPRGDSLGLRPEVPRPDLGQSPRPRPEGNSTRTAGLLVAMDDAGYAILARLEPGTGRQAAAALAPALARLRPWQAARAEAAPLHTPALKTAPLDGAASEPSTVQVLLLELLRSKRLEVRNLGTSPIQMGRGYLGPRASRSLRPGDRCGPGLLELRDAATGLARRFEGSLACGRSPRGALRLTATLTAREYVSGVLAAELPHGSSARRVELGAAVLRFLAGGPRHAGVEVCDSTHCAWFVGRGPRVAWVTPRKAVLQEAAAMDPRNGLPDTDWTAIREAAPRPGPALWTAHCGGQPLSPHALWGHGDHQVEPCPRHGPEASRPWTRAWKEADLLKAFGTPVRSLKVAMESGTWTLRIEGGQESWALGYDEAHRRLAAILGWDALPSPADTLEAVPGGYRAQGVGWGHRVGLCLGE